MLCFPGNKDSRGRLAVATDATAFDKVTDLACGGVKRGLITHPTWLDLYSCVIGGFCLRYCLIRRSLLVLLLRVLLYL